MKQHSTFKNSQNPFLKKNSIFLRIRSEDHLDQSLLIVVRCGEKEISKIFYCEARETQTWLQFALASEYINDEQFGKLHNEYNQITGMLVTMIGQSEKWCSFSSLNKEDDHWYHD